MDHKSRDSSLRRTSAWDLIDMVDSITNTTNTRLAWKVQTEMVDEGKKLHETSLAVLLYSHSLCNGGRMLLKR
jgi:hypothetical protein